MPIELLMPALSPTMTEGNLAKWHKKEGDPVKSGDVIAEIETDKATMEFEAADDGILGRILVPEGAQGIKVNAPIALLLEPGEDKAALDRAKPKAGAKAEAAKPPPQAAPPPPPSAARVDGDGRIFASPLARRLAAEAKIDLRQLQGSGPHGRIVKSDIEAALEAGTAKPAPAAKAPTAPAAAPAPPARPAAGLGKDQVAALAGNPPYTALPITGMRRVVARRLTEAKQTIPHFYLTIDCDIGKLLQLRVEVNAASPVKISVNDFVIRAAALALRQVPRANASWSEEAILLWDRVDVAVAVALDDGLITPIIRDADKKGLGAIAAETKDLAARARAGKLKLTEFQGGTFSVSNLGMYGIKEFAAVINPPHGCILAVGAGEERAVARDGALAVATMMSLTLAVDHRVVDGAVGAQYLAAFKALVEAPLTILI
jgi:pyruvate dehydrogenase E2 component (dihydrolipoamide acetyltransferase)